MRVVYYCLPGLLEHVPPQIQALSQFAEIYLVLEASPRAWQHNLLDLPQLPWGPGFHDGREFMRRHLPYKAWTYFEGTAGIYFSTYAPGLSPHGARSVIKTVLGIRRIAPDIIHLDGESIRSLLWVPLIQKPLVINVHDPRVVVSKDQPAANWVKKMLIPRAAHIIVHSEECRRGLLEQSELTRKNITKATLGSMDMFKAWLPENRDVGSDCRRVLFWGWLTPRKGIDVLLSAAPAVAEAVPGVHFIIAGRPRDGFIAPQPQDLPNGGKVTVIPRRLSNQELATHLSLADVIALPYREARQSGVILTAYSFGKPVVASDIDGLREQVWPGETGLLVPPNESGALADALVQILLNEDLLKEMEQRIPVICSKHLSWETFGEQVSRVYNAVLS